MSARVLPILFSSPMVSAMLGGRKTNTRRALRPQPESCQATFGEAWSWRWPGNGFAGVTTDQIRKFGVQSGMARYAVGDLLWVREAWRAPASMDRLAPAKIATSALAAGYPRPWCPIEWSADGKRTGSRDEWNGERAGRERRGMHLPRAFSRLTLHVTTVRVERLQDISEADAIAEGAWRVRLVGPPGSEDQVCYSHGQDLGPLDAPFTTAKASFRHLWNSINGDGAWEANPWVAAYEFRWFDFNVDRVAADPRSFGVAA